MKKNIKAFEKLNAQNFKIVDNTENIAGGEFHHHHPKTYFRKPVRTETRHGHMDHEVKMCED